jgi:hypothetical protein
MFGRLERELTISKVVGARDTTIWLSVRRTIADLHSFG